MAELYANAYEGTGMTADEIWEECICDSLGDMNIFAGEEAIGTFLDQMLPEISSTASKSESANKTEDHLMVRQVGRLIPRLSITNLVGLEQTMLLVRGIGITLLVTMLMLFITKGLIGLHLMANI